MFPIHFSLSDPPKHHHQSLLNSASELGTPISFGDLDTVPTPCKIYVIDFEYYLSDQGRAELLEKFLTLLKEDPSAYPDTTIISLRDRDCRNEIYNRPNQNVYSHVNFNETVSPEEFLHLNYSMYDLPTFIVAPLFNA